MKMRRLLVVACAALALSLACATNQLRSVGGVHHGGAPAAPVIDSFDALLPASQMYLSPPPPRSDRRTFIAPQFPPSRMATADVFRPPQART